MLCWYVLCLCHICHMPLPCFCTSLNIYPLSISGHLSPQYDSLLMTSPGAAHRHIYCSRVFNTLGSSMPSFAYSGCCRLTPVPLCPFNFGRIVSTVAFTSFETWSGIHDLLVIAVRAFNLVSEPLVMHVSEWEESVLTAFENRKGKCTTFLLWCRQVHVDLFLSSFPHTDCHLSLLLLSAGSFSPFNLWNNGRHIPGCFVHTCA